MISRSHLSAALCALVAAILFAACRAFEPPPVIFNRPPDTFLTGAPGEETGTGFERHLYWHGTDRDGEVVGFWYAVTDSTSENLFDVFDPAGNVGTLVNEPGRTVGYTSANDSMFVFRIDRGSTPSKDITFHIAAVDDRGGIDPTPARLYFFINGLGNPTVRYRVWTEDETGSDPGERRLRWEGTAAHGPVAGSPQTSSQPWIGFGRRFRVEWEASSPNGPIEGYRVKPLLNPLALYEPAEIDGVPQWDVGVNSLVFENAMDPDQLACDPVSLENCSPRELRWPTGAMKLRVQAIDVAGVTSVDETSELEINVNYAPESWIETQTYSPPGETESLPFPEEGVTLPRGSIVSLQLAGHDPREGGLVSADDPFCCDQVDDPRADDARCQIRVLVWDRRGVEYRSARTLARADPLLQFRVGPFRYRAEARCLDEHGRADATPDVLEFVGGRPPEIDSIYPGNADRIILAPAWQNEWSENTVHLDTESATLFWDGRSLSDVEADCSVAITGHFYRFDLRFAGVEFLGEPERAIRAWSYRYKSEADRSGLVVDGPRESLDLIHFLDAPDENEWSWTAELFVPVQIWFEPDRFEADPDEFEECTEDRAFAELGGWLRRRLGVIQVDAVGRTTRADTPFDLPVSPEPTESPQHETINIGPLGRQSPIHTTTFEFRLGLPVPGDSSSLDRLWPAPSSSP